MVKKCILCGATQNLTEHTNKIPKKYQARFGGKKTETWYSSDHKCPKLVNASKDNSVLNNYF